MTTEFENLASLECLVGQQIGQSDWIVVDQGRIDRFAEVTGDHQWIHVDPHRASGGPYGQTVAHGLLTLSLVPWMLSTAFKIGDSRMGVNYGFNKVRFPAPVPVNSRLRGSIELLAFSPVARGAQLTTQVSIEREGSEKPVCVAESVMLRLT